jgi:YidC/Oxa1 family membrane protein insertase
VAGEPNRRLTGTLFAAPLGVHWPLLAATPAYLGLAALLLPVVAWVASRRQARLASEAKQTGQAGESGYFRSAQSSQLPSYRWRRADR